MKGSLTERPSQRRAVSEALIRTWLWRAGSHPGEPFIPAPHAGDVSREGRSMAPDRRVRAGEWWGHHRVGRAFRPPDRRPTPILLRANSGNRSVAKGCQIAAGTDDWQGESVRSRGRFLTDGRLDEPMDERANEPLGLIQCLRARGIRESSQVLWAVNRDLGRGLAVLSRFDATASQVAFRTAIAPGTERTKISAGNDLQVEWRRYRNLVPPSCGVAV